MTARWLAIIGIGEDGRAGLSAAANALIDGADLLIGGHRHLDLIGATRGEQRLWSVPLEATAADILAARGKRVVVLASGDPFWFGAGVTLARSIPTDEMLVIPAPSSLSLAAARMGWALQDTVTLGLNMRGLVPLIRRHLHQDRHILALSLNGETPREVAALLTASGFGPSRMTVFEALGGPREARRDTTAEKFNLESIDPLNLMAVDVHAGPNARPIPFAAGLDDSDFENDGQLTKREIRAVTVSSLAPCPGQLLWDVGLGCGSVAIEWLLAHPANLAIGIEKSSDRAARAARNAISLGVPHLDIRNGVAPDAVSGLPPPDAIFIGGGASAPGVLDACWRALKPGGRLVANGVTLETEALFVGARAKFGGSLTRLSIERADAVGNRTGWRPSMAVTQWTVTKPWSGA